MVKWLIAKINGGRAYFAAEDFRRGYDQAAGALLRGDESVLSLLNSVLMDERGDVSHSDAGVLAAVDDYNGLLRGKA